MQLETCYPAIVLVLISVCGDARVETRVASGFNRGNRALHGASPMWTGNLSSAALCLGACVQLSCQSLTFGGGKCNAYSTYLCHPEDRFHLSLVSSFGTTYFDLSLTKPPVPLMRKKESCVVHGRCVEICEEGTWTTTTTTEYSDGMGNTTIDANFEHTTKHGTKKEVINENLRITSKQPSLVTKTTVSVTTSSTTSKPISSVATNSATKTSQKSQSKGSKKRQKPNEKLGAGLLLIQTPPLAFDDALSHCRKKNLSLAMPENNKEHDILVEAMQKRGIGRMWIGVKKVIAGGRDAIYVDGRNVSNTLLLWGDGQPNNSRGGQICVEMNASLKFLWNDFDCLHKTAFVCR